MYLLKTDSSFDSAHFLHGYDGKCSNIHGHHWRVFAGISQGQLIEHGGERGMVVDFARFKSALRQETEYLDHSLMVEKGSLKDSTVLALESEGFKLIMLDFRPTAENLSKYFFDKLKAKGYPASYVEVCETPKNCAIYAEDANGRI